MTTFILVLLFMVTLRNICFFLCISIFMFSFLTNLKLSKIRNTDKIAHITFTTSKSISCILSSPFVLPLTLIEPD